VLSQRLFIPAQVIRKAALESLYYNVKITEQKINDRRERKLYHEALVAKSERRRLVAVVKQDERVQTEKKEKERRERGY
jgi:hypothetical protein